MCIYSNKSYISFFQTLDQTNYTVSQDQMHLRCEKQRSSWIRLRRNRKAAQGNTCVEDREAPLLQEQVSSDFTESLSNLPAMDVPSIIFPCIHDALKWLSCGREAMLQGDLLQPPAFPPPRKLEEASQVQVCNHFFPFIYFFWFYSLFLPFNCR